MCMRDTSTLVMHIHHALVIVSANCCNLCWEPVFLQYKSTTTMFRVLAEAIHGI